jgi:hypothetical protein
MAVSAAKQTMLSTKLRAERIDACVVGETKLADDLLLGTLRECGWHTRARGRTNLNTGGVALLIDASWAVEDIDTEHEDVVCAQITCADASRTYTIIGAYIPHGSDMADSVAVFSTIRKLYETYENAVILGDLNAHTGNMQELAARTEDISDRVVDASHNPNPRGYLLFDMLDQTNAVMTNGRKDGSRSQPSQLYTYTSKSHHTQSLIDYIILSTTLYAQVASHKNTYIHNTVVKTDHALCYVTIHDCIKPKALPSRTDRSGVGRQKRKRQSVEPKEVFVKYQLQMYRHVRVQYADDSDHDLANWTSRELPGYV